MVEQFEKIHLRLTDLQTSVNLISSQNSTVVEDKESVILFPLNSKDDLENAEKNLENKENCIASVGYLPHL